MPKLLIAKETPDPKRSFIAQVNQEHDTINRPAPNPHPIKANLPKVPIRPNLHPSILNHSITSVPITLIPNHLIGRQQHISGMEGPFGGQERGQLGLFGQETGLVGAFVLEEQGEGLLLVGAEAGGQGGGDEGAVELLLEMVLDGLVERGGLVCEPSVV